MILIKNIAVYQPAFAGVNDVLIGGEKILAIEQSIDISSLKNLEITVIDGSGKKLIPGLIDAHAHIAGAGGEGGPATRTPEMQLTQMINGGITTIVGCLGTDGFTRSLQSVLMKAKAIKQEGLSAFMYTGAYQVPTPTLLGDVAKDIAMLEEVIGVGEIALSDHRSSCPTTDELIRLVEHARIGGMLGGKAGIVNIHMGDAKNPFQPIYDAVNKSELKLTQFYPTHITRNPYIFEDAKIYGKQGFVDLTASSYPYDMENEIKPSKAIGLLMKAGVSLEHITITSDGNGSLPLFDNAGKLIKVDMGYPNSIFTELKDAVLVEKMALEIAVKVVTSNVSDILKLKQKGRIMVGFDADVVIVDNDFAISEMIARGQLFIHNYMQIKKGMYE